MTWKGAWLASGDDGAAGEGNFKSENQFLWLRSGNPTKDRKTTVSLLAFFSLFSPSRTSEGSQHPFAVVRAKRPVSEWASGRSPAERGRDLPTGRAFPNCPGNTWPTPPETKTEGKERRSWVLIKVAQQVKQAGAVQYQKGCDASVWTVRRSEFCSPRQITTSRDCVVIRAKRKGHVRDRECFCLLAVLAAWTCSWLLSFATAAATAALIKGWQ